MTIDAPKPARTARLTASVLPKPSMMFSDRRNRYQLPAQQITGPGAGFAAQQRFGLQLRHGHGSTAGPPMTGSDDGDERLPPPGARGKARSSIPPFHGCNVGFTAFQPGDDIRVRADPLFDRDAGALAKGRDMRLQQIGANIARGRQAQRRELDQAAHTAGRLDQRARQRQEAGALIGRHGASTPAYHQRRGQDFLQLADMIHDGGWRQIKFACRRTNAPRCDHGHE